MRQGTLEVPLMWNAQVFLNIVLDEAVEEKAGGEKVRIGMVVIRGNSVVMLEVWNVGPRVYTRQLMQISTLGSRADRWRPRSVTHCPQSYQAYDPGS
jgi:hypothetical protein